MTALHIYALVCDGCGTRFQHDSKRAYQIRSVAARDGWSFEAKPIRRAPAKPVDLCPTCSKLR